MIDIKAGPRSHGSLAHRTSEAPRGAKSSASTLVWDSRRVTPALIPLCAPGVLLDLLPEAELEPEPEPETQDATMDDAPSPPAPAEKSKANLEELFDDDSDGEFASSAPVKSEEDASQPAPV